MGEHKFINIKIVKDIIIFFVFIVFAGTLSVTIGMDRNTDVKNYHIYNAWAFLNDRIGFDLLPADIQSYFNPLPDIPYFLMIKYFNNHPAIVTFLWGFSYALFLFIIYKISKFIFKDYYKLCTTAVSIMIASGVFMVVRHIGWLSHDILVADLALVSLYFILKSFGKAYHPKLLFCAGLITGTAVGLKYTAVIFAIPLLLSFFIFYRQFTNPKKSFLLLLAGMVTGFLVTDGFWLYKLYRQFHNPLFPYFNWIFHSDYIAMPNVFTTDFSQDIEHIQKKTFLLYPLFYKIDLHFQIFYSLFFVNLCTLPFVNKQKFQEIFKINLNYTDFIFIFSFISYIALAKSFAVVRYYAPLSGLVGIGAIIVLLKLFYILRKILLFLKEKTKINLIPDIIKYNSIYIAIILICLSLIFIPDYLSAKGRPGSRVPVQKELITVTDIEIPDNSIVLAQRSTGIVIPFQNPIVQYIGLNSCRFTKKNMVLLSNKYIQKIKNSIKKSPKHVFILTTTISPEEDEYIKTELNRLDLKISLNHDTEIIKTNFGKNYYLVKLEIK